jgi:hypothetical protein
MAPFPKLRTAQLSQNSVTNNNMKFPNTVTQTIINIVTLKTRTEGPGGLCKIRLHPVTAITVVEPETMPVLAGLYITSTRMRIIMIRTTGKWDLIFI